MKRSEAQNRAVVETAVDSIITIDKSGVIGAVNGATRMLFGYSESELLGQNVRMLMPQPFRREHDGYLQNYADTGTKKVIGIGREVIGQRKDGSTFPLYLSVGEVEQDGVTMYTGFIRDISKEKQFEKEILASNEVLSQQNILKNNASRIADITRGSVDLPTMSDDIITALAEMTNSGHGVLYVLEGATRAEENTDLSLVLTGSYAFKRRKNVLAKVAIGEGLVGQSAKERKTILLTQAPMDYIQISSALGEQLPINILVTPILFERQLLGVIELASFQEYSDTQQQMVEEISANIGVVINNVRNQLRTQQLLEDSQFQAEELQAQQEELKSSNENLEEQTRLLQRSQSELTQQSEELRASNEELESKHVELVMQKTDIENARQDLSIKANELALASKYKSEFLANMSHELRTPLNSLLLLAKGLAENKEGNLTDIQVEDAKVIYGGGNSLLSLINDIMDLSKVEAGKLSIHREQVSFDTLKKNVCNLFDPVARDKNLQFEVAIGDELPDVIISDGQRLEQILRNLLSNAMKFTLDGSVKLQIDLPSPQVNFSHSDLRLDTAIAFSVTDTGVGIPADKQQAIFEAFQQQDGSTSRKYGGTGLGLTIARELTRLLGGEIQLQSTEEEGSVFTLYLPRELQVGESDARPKPQQLKVPSKPSAAARFKPKIDTESLTTAFVPDDRDSFRMGTRSLLVIDDDKSFCVIVQKYAKRSGYQVLVAGDGRSGIQLAEHFLPSGIVLDLGLPDMGANKYWSS